MSVRQFPDLLLSGAWSLIAREDRRVSPKTLLPSRSFLVQNSHLIAVGIASENADPTWVTGGWVSQLLSFTPSSTSQFPPVVEAKRHKVRLGVLTLLEFPRLADQWTLEISFPKWLYETKLEIWKYAGRDFDEFTPLAQINEQLGRIEARLENP